MIDIKDVSFSYSLDNKKTNLSDINIHIKKGECILLCGKSGCGKTSITKLVNGLIPHYNKGYLNGKTTVNGMLVEDTNMYKLSEKVGSVFQNPKSQFFNIDSNSELAFGLENNGVDPKLIRERINRTVSDLNIEHLLNRDIFSMSGGEKQSLAFASVYAMNPDIYVLDEPSANLDSQSIDKLAKQLKIVKEQGKSIIIAEHRLYYLMDIIDRAILIVDGKIEEVYTKEQFLKLTEEERCKKGLRTICDRKFEFNNNHLDNYELEVKNLTVKRNKKTVLHNINIKASSGNIVGILGKNGAGKTTLVRCIAGLLKEHNGSIQYKGKSLSRKERNKICYMIMQDVNHQLFGGSVWEECNLSTDKGIDDDKINNLLSEFNLIEYKENHPMSLSGGQKQRLAIITGIISKKKVLIFDEPTSGLDYNHMCVVSKVLKDLAKKGHIVFVVTHDLEFLEITCNQVVQIPIIKNEMEL